MRTLCKETQFSTSSRAGIFLAAISLLTGLAACFDSNVEKDVLTLSDKSINSSIPASGQSLLLELYAPWCGHCQKLAPEYGAAASVLRESNLPVTLAKIDATENSKTADWLNVKGYPTLIWFSDGQQEAYSAGRSKDAIVNWVKKRLVGIEVLSSLEDLQRSKERSEVFLVGYFDQDESKELEAFKEAGRAIEEWPVYKTSSSEIAAALGISHSPAFAVGTTFEFNKGVFKSVASQGHKAFSGGLPLKESILTFLKTEQLPPYLPYSSATNERVFAMERQIFLVGPLLELQPDKPALKVVTATHSRFKGDFAFATAALGTDPADMILDFFGLKKVSEIQVVGFVPEVMKYKLLEPLSDQSLSDFCLGIMSGTYQRYYKSAPVPPKPSDGFVKIIVGSTYEELVLDPNKDVLLMVYTIWSDKSKHLMVMWKKMALYMRQAESLVVAKIEAENNQHPHLTGDAFPYVLFYAAGAQQPIKYSGDPNMRDILRFVRQEAAISIDFSAKPPRTMQNQKEEL